KEGIWVGNSAGSAMAGLLQLKDNFKKGETVVVVFHDHGTRYLGKIFNDEWMREKGYIDVKGMTARDLVSSGKNGNLITIDENLTVADAVKLISKHDISQLPVTADNRIVGSLNENMLFSKIIQNPEIKNSAVKQIMQEALPFVDASTPLNVLSDMMKGAEDAVLVKDFKQDKTYIITRYDIVQALAI
ncbi:MAG TPA: CBS domain-containing protein, partial [Bacteroidia bacterium]|nr:CBS domain-containing protein [Bacteroidia bacterium]